MSNTCDETGKTQMPTFCPIWGHAPIGNGKTGTLYCVDKIQIQFSCFLTFELARKGTASFVETHIEHCVELIQLVKYQITKVIHTMSTDDSHQAIPVEIKNSCSHKLLVKRMAYIQSLYVCF